MQFKKQKKVVLFSYKKIYHSIKEDSEWNEICMVSKQAPHILCVHLECPMVPAQPSTKAVLLVSRGDAFHVEEPTLKLLEVKYGDIPIIATDECGKQLWNNLNEEEYIEGRIFALNQRKELDSELTASKTEQGAYDMHVILIGITVVQHYSHA